MREASGAVAGRGMSAASLVEVLRQEGVTHLFTLVGGHINPILDAARDVGLVIVDTRHEQAAVHMADGWARVTGATGVAVVTAGPGVLNAIPGVGNAFYNHSPVVVIGGAPPQNEVDRVAPQEVDQVPLLAPITKWARRVTDPRRLAEYAAHALRHARAGRPGPAYLEVPLDVLLTPAPPADAESMAGAQAPAVPAGDPAAIEQAARLLETADRPVVIVGSGAFWAAAGPTLRRWADVTGMPTFTLFRGRGVLPDDHPVCFGPTRVGTREADVILALGTRFSFALGYGRPPLFTPAARVIQVDVHAEEIGRHGAVTVGIVGDVRLVLDQLLDRIGGRIPPGRHAAWCAHLRQQAEKRTAEVQALAASDHTPIHPLRLAAEIQAVLDRDATVILDGGDISAWGAMVLRAYRPGHFLDNGILGFLGAGIPYALAAQLARPATRVLALVGDGTFGLNGFEMDTAVRHRLPVVVVVGNDRAWGMNKHEQELRYGPGRVIASELGDARYDQVMTAFGGFGALVESPHQIRPALERAFGSGQPAVLNVLIDPSAVSPATRRFVSGGPA